ncbi:MAG: hypothetical protein KIT73_15745 [Burkholderiales bacterium]|nr:hypothetical protein [Burkholderiales bacterium]
MSDAPEVDLDALLESTKENQEWLRKRIKKIREIDRLRGAFATKRLVKLIADHGVETTDDRIDNFVSMRAGLAPEAYGILIRHMLREGWCSDSRLREVTESRSDALFLEIRRFLDVGFHTIDRLKTEIPGLFRVWRASMHVPGAYIRGMLEIEHRPDTDALWTVETQAFRGEEEAAPHDEIFEGYIMKKSHYYVMFSRQQQGHAGPPRVTVIHNVLRHSGLIQAMEGVMTGTYGANSLFSTPIYIERVLEEERAALRDSLDIVATIPSSVRAKLRFRVENDVIRY